MMGVVDLMFCVACLATGKFVIGLDTDTLRTLTVITLVFSGQALFYVVREREHLWSSPPGRWLVLSSIIDVTLMSALALNGFLMTPIPLGTLIGVFLAAIIFTFVLDAAKSFLFLRLAVA
jgi:H+-transporting ATPase